MSFRIWSNEHNAWWRAGSRGYTVDLDEAGIFNGHEAFQIAYQSAMGSPPGEPKEILVGADGLRFKVELLRGEDE